MSKKRPAHKQIRDQATEHGAMMAQCCFDGEIARFHALFDAYLDKHSGSDPFGRTLLEIQSARGTGLVSFRSTSTDPGYLNEQSAIRWAAWMSVLPLDLQIELMIMESSPRLPVMVDVATLKWDQWWDIQESPDPEATYAKGALSQSRNGPEGPMAPTPWFAQREHLVSSVQCHAMQLMSWKSWSQLEDWMAASRLHAREQMVNVYVHYKEKYARGSTLAKPLQPLPFWTTGLFTGATDPAFWDVMQKFGGPASARAVFQEMANPAACLPPIDGRPMGRPLAPCPPADQWTNPLSWVQPYVSLSQEAIDQADRTRASWMGDAMHASVDLPSQAPKSHPRL